MVIRTQTGLNTTGFFEMRSGRCPDCNELFDDRAQKPQGDKRYCPKCKRYKLGNIKQAGVLVKKQ